MNFWPFSKKTKVGIPETSDLPPGVILALSEDEPVLEQLPASAPTFLPEEKPVTAIAPGVQESDLPPLPPLSPIEPTKATLPLEEAVSTLNQSSLNQSLAAALEEALAQQMLPLSLSDTGFVLTDADDRLDTPGDSSDNFDESPLSASDNLGVEDFGPPESCMSVWPAEPDAEALSSASSMYGSMPAEMFSPDLSSCAAEESFGPTWDSSSLQDAETSFDFPAFPDLRSWTEREQPEEFIGEECVDLAPESELPPVSVNQPLESHFGRLCPSSDEEKSESSWETAPAGPIPEEMAESLQPTLQTTPALRTDFETSAPSSSSFPDMDVRLPDTDGQSFLSAENESLIIRLENFERDVMRQEMQFLKRSIDKLVDAYFSCQEPDYS